MAVAHAAPTPGNLTIADMCSIALSSISFTLVNTRLPLARSPPPFGSVMSNFGSAIVAATFSLLY
jgi:hypothetical protein